MNAFLVLLTFVFIMIVQLVQNKYQFRLPWELQVLLMVFIYAGVFLGGVREFYDKLWWFDSLLHITSGLGLGFFGFLIPYSFWKTGKLKAGPFLIVFFGFCFALTLAVIWEIYEFGVDQIFGLNMQKARNLEVVYGFFDTRLGVLDTIHDLILNTLGALVASTAGYIYLKRGKIFIFDKLVKKTERNNPKFFK